MINHCKNTVVFTNTSKERIDELQNVLEYVDDFFQYYRPIPELVIVIGDVECNDWCMKNWGVKEDVYIEHWERITDTSITLSFYSDWNPPIEFYEFMVKNGWNIEAYYSEPIMCSVGKFYNGKNHCYEYDLDNATTYNFIPEDIREYGGI